MSVAPLVALCLAASAVDPGQAAAPLRVDLPVDLSITAGAAAASGVLLLLERDLVPSRCRWCTPDRFDAWVRDRAAWARPSAAAALSDGLEVLVPLGATASLAIPSLLRGDRRRAAEDTLLVAEAWSLALVATEVGKVTTARLRPYALAAGARGGGVDTRLSFPSGHTSSTFAAAAAGGTVALLRGDERWPWILGVGLGAATVTGYARIAADRHWATDVLAGAGLGAAAGVLTPLLHRTTAGRLTLLPAPGGLAIAW